MNNINKSTFKKDILPTAKTYIISPYASREFFLYGHTVVLSDKVSEITTVKHNPRNKKIEAYVFPTGKSIKEVVKDNVDLIRKFLRVDATFLGVFDSETEELVFQMSLR